METSVNFDSLLQANTLLKPTSSLLTTSRDLSKTSERYKMTRDVEALASFNAAGFQLSAYKEVKARNPDMQSHKTYRAIYQNPALGTLADGTSFTIIQKGASDGTNKLVITAGLFRILCTNTMVVGRDLFDPVAIKHIGEVDSQLDNLVDRLLDVAPRVFNTVKQMTARTLSPVEQIEFAAKAAELRFNSKEFNIDPKVLLEARRPSDEGATLWNTFQRIQEGLIKGGYQVQSKLPKEDGSDRKARKAMSLRNINMDFDVNTGLWSEAQKYLN